MPAGASPASCPFCEIIAGQRPGFIIAADESTVVLLSLENRPLVLPRTHLSDLWSLDDETAAAVMSKSIRVARALRDALPCDGVYVTQTNGASAGQSVFHYHMHSTLDGTMAKPSIARCQGRISSG